VARSVLLLSWEYPPIVEGGLARHVRKLAEGLVREGVTVHVLSRGRPGDPPEELRAGVRVHRVPEPATPRDLDAFLAWIEAMNGDLLTAGLRVGAHARPAVVHGHDWLVAEAAGALADALGVPYVTTIHATEFGRHQGWVQQHPQRVIHATETWMARRADRLVVCSHYMRGHVADVFELPERRVEVIPNGIDPLDLRPVGDLPELRARFAAPHEKLVLLVGRLVYEKGFQIALDALPRVLRRAGDVRFLVAGSGTYEAELKAQAQRLGLSGHGTFAGWIGDDVLHSLYRIADLCVVPSLFEPFGLVALEAMASGCPCIVADTGGLREVVPNDDVGLRFGSRDPRELSRLMELVLTNPALRFRLVTEAAQHVRGFDWAEVARRTAALYTGVARTKRPRRWSPALPATAPRKTRS
jgi:glycogen synthase